MITFVGNRSALAGYSKARTGQPVQDFPDARIKVNRFG